MHMHEDARGICWLGDFLNGSVPYLIVCLVRLSHYVASAILASAGIKLCVCTTTPCHHLVFRGMISH